MAGRSPLRRFRFWYRERARRLGQSVAGPLRSWRRGWVRLKKTFLSLIAPQWLRKVTQSTRKSLRRAETSVVRTQKKVNKTVAQSAVGQEAKKLAKEGKRLESRLNAIIRNGFKFIGTLLSALVPAPLRRLFRSMGQSIWQSIHMVGVFIGRWFKTRHYWHLVGGIPAFLLALPLTYCMIRMPFHTVDRKAKHYRTAAREALKEKDYATAGLFYRKLHQLGAMTESVEFQSAINQFESGEETEALAAIRRLAPDDQPGFAPAHLWRANRYMNNESSTDSDAALAEAEKHIRFAIDREPGNVLAKSMMAEYYQRTGKYVEAETMLRSVSNLLPEHGLTLVSVYLRLGRPDDARRQAERIIAMYQANVEKGGELSAREYVVWASANQLVDGSKSAEDILRKAYEKYPDHEGTTRMLCDVLTRNAKSDFDRREGDPQDVVDRYLLAATVNPKNHDSLILLADAIRNPSRFGRHALEVVLALLDQGDAPPKLYSVVAPVIGLGGDLPRAIRYLRTAVELDPKDSYSLNNLAFCLMRHDQDHDREALDLVEQALAIEPDEATYRETRGQLLLRLGRYDDAVADLNFALNKLGDVHEIHNALADAYEQLGQPEQARIHRSRGL